jgi:hypothetical protein
VASPQRVSRPMLGQAMTRRSSRAGSSQRLGELASDRLVRFPGQSWQEIEALPQPVRWTVQRTIFHLLSEPVPSVAGPFPPDDPLPGAYELHLPADQVTIWYTLSEYEGREIISIQLVRLDT